jgi:peroxiredoxin Q/BCP
MRKLIKYIFKEKVMIEIGNKAPDFKLPDQDEKIISLNDFKGKWIILYFYPKDNTPGCTQEACDFSVNIKDFNDLDADVIGISPDSPASHKKFIDKYSLKVILVSDPEHKILEEYGAWQLKKMYGKEYMGVVRSTFLINPDGNIAKVWEKVSVKGHIEDVKNVLKELKGK